MLHGVIAKLLGAGIEGQTQVSEKTMIGVANNQSVANGKSYVTGSRLSIAGFGMGVSS